MDPEINQSEARNLVIALGEVMHQVQRERGTAALFAETGNETHAKRFAVQIRNSNKAVKACAELVKGAGQRAGVVVHVMRRVLAVMTRLEQLPTIRRDVRLLSDRSSKYINDYTFRYLAPLLDAQVELAKSIPGFDSARVSAYANFVMWKERLGLERALGSRGFEAHAFRNTEYCDHMVAVLAEQGAYFNTFMSLADNKQTELVRQVMDGSDMRQIQEINGLIESGAPPAQIEKFTGEAWFELLTRTIDRLREVEISLVEDLDNAPVLDGEARDFASPPSSAMDAFRPFIRSLPLFSRVSEKELSDLLKQAQLRNYEKGKLLFLEGEPMSRLYVVLRGWVKLFNGRESGEEATLQMLSSGESLVESAILLNTAAPVSAQVIEDAIILSVPGPVIRFHLERSNQFAVSMLNNLSLRSEHLVRQIEQSRLKSARERLGWFLLKHYLEQEERDLTVRLPFDKATIASYLDMRPETLSRAFRDLKELGFEVEEDRVSLPGPRGLCEYCDSYLAQGCVRAGKSDCPKGPEILRDAKMF